MLTVSPGWQWLCDSVTLPRLLRRAKKSITTGRVTVLLEFPSTANNLRILTAATTQIPTGAAHSQTHVFKDVCSNTVFTEHVQACARCKSRFGRLARCWRTCMSAHGAPCSSAAFDGLVARQGAITPPSTFFNAEAAYGTSVAVSKTGFLPANGGLVRARLSFELAGGTLPALQFSWQFATNLPAPQSAFFFLNADTIVLQVDKAGLPTIKGLVDTLIP